MSLKLEFAMEEARFRSGPFKLKWGRFEQEARGLEEAMAGIFVQLRTMDAAYSKMSDLSLSEEGKKEKAEIRMLFSFETSVRVAD